MIDWPFPGLEPGAYSVIIADPPWRFRTWGPGGNGRAPAYETMTAASIEALPVRALAGPRCLLALWTTAPFIDLSLGIMKGWGFRYSTALAWGKQSSTGWAIGTGYHWRSTAEFVLIGKVGQPPWAKGLALPNLIVAPRREHSRKPDRLHSDLERMYPAARKAELFARQQRPGWDCWGNESDKFGEAA
jgi:N6-adenosine-specific RNA methylase IME4